MKSWPSCFRLLIVVRKNDLNFQRTSMEEKTLVSGCGLGSRKDRDLMCSDEKALISRRNCGRRRFLALWFARLGMSS